jgi:hypothetical protein
VKMKFLLCVQNEGYETSLEVQKLYENIPDKEAERNRQVRIIDESGEDYHYPEKYFAPVRLLAETKTRFLRKCEVCNLERTPELLNIMSRFGRD